MLSNIDINAVQMMIYRGGLVCVAAYTFWGALGRVKPTDTWYPNGLALVPGMTRFAAGPLRRLLVAVFAVSAACYMFKVGPLPSALFMCLSFQIALSLFQSGPWTGYFAVLRSGKAERVLFHLTHLTGLCVLGILIAEVIAAVMRLPRAPFTGTDAADNVFLQVIWSCIGAYYCTSGLSKLRVQGLRWIDRRLFPYYITFAKFFAMGDGYEQKGRVANILINGHRIGLVLLAVTLACELGGAFYAFGSIPRLIVGGGLIAFHIGSQKLLVPFTKNLIILLVFSFNHVFIVNWFIQLLNGGEASVATLAAMAGNPNGDFLLGFIVFAAIIVVSFLLGEKFYPFSVLSMFTSPYRPQRVCLMADAAEEKILPMPQMTGRTTLSTARELSFHMDTGGSLEAFIESLEERMKSFKGEDVPSHYRLVIKTVDVERGGKIKVDEMSLERQIKL